MFVAPEKGVREIANPDVSLVDQTYRISCMFVAVRVGKRKEEGNGAER
jgi:hypothetical protein